MVNPREPSCDLAISAHALRINCGRPLSVRGRPGEGGDGNAGRAYPSATASGQVNIQGSLCVALQVWGIMDSWCGWCREFATEVVTPRLFRPVKTLALHLAIKMISKPNVC